MNDLESIMQRAVSEAKLSNEPLKCGVIIVKDGEVIAKAHNTQRGDHDPSAHAEINALRIAGSKMQTKNLEGCSVYCTCEPCVMCLAALVYAKVRSVTYAVPLKKAYPKKWIDISIAQFLGASPHKFEINGPVMEDQVLNELYLYQHTKS